MAFFHPPEWYKKKNFKLMIDISDFGVGFMFGGVNKKVLGSDNFCPSECSFWGKTITRNWTAGSKIQVSIYRVWSWLIR